MDQTGNMSMAPHRLFDRPIPWPVCVVYRGVNDQGNLFVVIALEGRDGLQISPTKIDTDSGIANVIREYLSMTG